MTLTRLVLAWGVGAVWYALVDAGLGRYWPAAGVTFRPKVILAETLLLTMFAALWFGSLGHGGWWLLFLVLGALMEGPVRARHRIGAAPGGGRPWLDAAIGICRVVIAGGLLSWRLS
ncbi:MAG TPA: hypothetical protein VFU45_03105 [Gemmatimonadales bacterium]|nr:hypothetical protein [Gemmatimonadales bacterium]